MDSSSRTKELYTYVQKYLHTNQNVNKLSKVLKNNKENDP